MKKGQSLIEYALGLAVIAIVAVAVMGAMASSSSDAASWLPDYVTSFRR